MLLITTTTSTSTSRPVPLPPPPHSDEENPYLRSGPPPPAPPPSLRARVAKEASSRWYLWAALAFATLLVGGLVVFREALLEGAAGSGLGRRVGLPTLAIRNNAAEACATECADASAELGGSGSAAALMSTIEGETSAAAAGGANVDDAYSTCYAKCVAQETKDVVQEHEQFVREEKEIAAEEKAAEEKAKAAAAAAEGGAAAAGGASGAAAAHHAVDAKTQEDKELEALLEEVLDSMP